MVQFSSLLWRFGCTVASLGLSVSCERSGPSPAARRLPVGGPAPPGLACPRHPPGWTSPALGLARPVPMVQLGFLPPLLPGSSCPRVPWGRTSELLWSAGPGFCEPEGQNCSHGTDVASLGPSRSFWHTDPSGAPSRQGRDFNGPSCWQAVTQIRGT